MTCCATVLGWLAHLLRGYRPWRPPVARVSEEWLTEFVRGRH